MVGPRRGGALVCIPALKLRCGVPVVVRGIRRRAIASLAMAVGGQRPGAGRVPAGEPLLVRQRQPFVHGGQLQQRLTQCRAQRIETQSLGTAFHPHTTPRQRIPGFRAGHPHVPIRAEVHGPKTAVELRQGAPV